MSNSQFCLEWDSHSRNLCTGLSSLQQNAEFVDMTLAADGHHVKVHQMVLALASPYIKELITSANCPHPVIFLNKVSYKTLCSILEYIYTGQTMVALEDINELITAAKDLHIKGLEDVRTTEGTLTTETTMNVDNTPAENMDVQIKLQNEETTKPTISNITTLKRKVQNDFGSMQRIPSNMPLRKRISNADMEPKQTQDLPDLSQEDMHYDDPLDDDRDDNDSTDVNETDYCVATKKATPSDGTQISLQYTLSNQGSLQLILNRFLYSLYYQYRDHSRQWRCTENRKTKCVASVFTKDNIVTRRVGAHSHPFHDKQILKKVWAGSVYTALQEAEAKVTKQPRMAPPQ